MTLHRGQSQQRGPRPPTHALAGPGCSRLLPERGAGVPEGLRSSRGTSAPLPSQGTEPELGPGGNCVIPAGIPGPGCTPGREAPEHSGVEARLQTGLPCCQTTSRSRERKSVWPSKSKVKAPERPRFCFVTSGIQDLSRSLNLNLGKIRAHAHGKVNAVLHANADRHPTTGRVRPAPPTPRRAA